MHLSYLKKFATAMLFVGLACVGRAQDAPAAKPADAQRPADASKPTEASTTAPAAAPAPLPTPSTIGPLQLALPTNLEAGPLGKYAINGAVSGMGVFQNNGVAGNNPQEGAFSNAMIFFQKTDGWFQFYVQAGAYDVVSLGSPFISNSSTIDNLWGPVPTAFGKVVFSKNTNIIFGILPTLIGAETTFDFQNMNIERGLLWNQESAISRGVQLNQTFGKFTASVSYNDGFYSNRYNWITGSLTYTNGPHSISFIGGGNLGQTEWQSLRTPIQNNSMIYNLIYTYTKGAWVIQPYLQYTDVPTNLKAGIPQGASTWGGAILATRVLKKGFSLTGRWEYIGQSGTKGSSAANLMYGPGSTAWSLTATPTYQYKKFFTRTDISFVGAGNVTPGDGFGTFGLKTSQTRGVVELGFLF
jgi:hypothetical protein